MSIRQWQKLFKDLEIRKSGLPSLVKPTDSILDHFEKETGFLLPRGYRDFIKVFGPGVLAWSYRILAPGYPEQGDSVDLVQFNQSAKKQFTKRFLKTTKMPEQILRTVYFVRRSGGDLIGWDPEDIQNVKNHEYGVYLLGGGPGMEKIANSFECFIKEVCLSEENLKIPPDVEEELGTRYIFEPIPDLSKQLNLPNF